MSVWPSISLRELLMYREQTNITSISLIRFLWYYTSVSSFTVTGIKAWFRKPLCETYWFYMGLALTPPPLCQTGKCGKKSAPNHPGKPLHPPPLQAMPIWKRDILKRGFPYPVKPARSVVAPFDVMLHHLYQLSI